MSVLPEIVRDHVIRATMAWRKAELTECGRELTDVPSAITADQLRDRIKEIGKQRTAFTVCMTCAGTYINHSPWDTDPVGVMRRETQRFGKPDENRLRDELRAIAALIEAHREEFDDFLSGLRQTTSLDDARKARRRAAYYGTHRPPTA